MATDEKLLVGRWFLGMGKMPAEIRDYIVQNKKIPDGLSDGMLLANDLKTQYEAHRVDVTAHNLADSTNVVTAPNATTLETLITLANDLKTQYEAHRIDATAHNSADTTNAVTLATATDIVSAVKLLNDLKTQYEAHRIDVTAHNSADSTNVVTAMQAFAWRQTWMGEAGGSYEFTPEFGESKRQLFGVVKIQRKSLAGKVTMPISTSKFIYLRDYTKLDPNATDADDVIWIEDNFGEELEGVPILAYEAEKDPGNLSDIPNFINSDEVLIAFEGVNKGTVKKDFNGEQGMLGLELDMLADTSGTAGKALGKKGGIGTFAKVT